MRRDLDRRGVVRPALKLLELLPQLPVGLEREVELLLLVHDVAQFLDRALEVRELDFHRLQARWPVLRVHGPSRVQSSGSGSVPFGLEPSIASSLSFVVAPPGAEKPPTRPPAASTR